VRITVRKTRKSRRTKKAKSAKSRAKGSNLPLGTFEEWIRVQDVKIQATPQEVDVPLDSYEAWIRQQTKKK